MSPRIEFHAGSCPNRHCARGSPFLCAVLLGVMLASGLIWPGASHPLPLTTPLNPQSLKTVQGEILKIDGDLYVIKPLSPLAGKEFQLRVDEKTVRIDVDHFTVGDMIIADVTPEGRALTISRLNP